MEKRKDLSGAVLHDTYRLVRKMAQGGMGELYEAEHARLSGKRYAVKLLLGEVADLPDMYARFRREAEITSALGHDNIVEVLDFYETDDGRPFMVMEYLQGEDLACLLERQGRLQPPEVVALAQQVGDALAAAHARGVVHRDMKPENIYMVPAQQGDMPWRAKVLDFGISKIRDSRSVVTMDRAVLGTPYYMSPEQAEGSVGDIDAATDIFALGTICYYSLTGRLPFDAPTMPGVIYKICHHEPQPPSELIPGLPAEVDAVIARALAKKKADRWPTVQAFVSALAEALQGAAVQRPAPITARGLGDIPAPAPAPAPAATREATTLSRSAGEQLAAAPRRGVGPVKIAGAAALALVLAAAGWALFAAGGEEPPAPDPVAAAAALMQDEPVAEAPTDAGLMEAPPDIARVDSAPDAGLDRGKPDRQLRPRPMRRPARRKRPSFQRRSKPRGGGSKDNARDRYESL